MTTETTNVLPIGTRVRLSALGLAHFQKMGTRPALLERLATVTGYSDVIVSRGPLILWDGADTPQPFRPEFLERVDKPQPEVDMARKETKSDQPKPGDDEKRKRERTKLMRDIEVEEHRRFNQTSGSKSVGDVRMVDSFSLKGDTALADGKKSYQSLLAGHGTVNNTETVRLLVLTHQGEAQYFMTKAEAKELGQWLTKRAETRVRKPRANKPKGPTNG